MEIRGVKRLEQCTESIPTIKTFRTYVFFDLYYFKIFQTWEKIIYARMNPCSKTRAPSRLGVRLVATRTTTAAILTKSVNKIGHQLVGPKTD